MKCLDTYALMAIAAGDARFEKYLNADFIMPDTTLAEFYWVLLRDKSETTAKEWIKKLRPYSSTTSAELFLEAMRFRFANKKKNFSFFDCVGYCFARQEETLFVTGDEQFKEMTGVEFIKSVVSD